MEDLSLIVSGLEYKVKKLVDLQNKLKAENQSLKIEKRELSEIVEKHQSSINQLEEKYKISRLAKSVEKGKETTEIKLKINEMVREIDKCIALLKR